MESELHTKKGVIMSELVKCNFPTKSLLKGLRAIGYSFSTAVADIIDNSISAEANRIDIFFDPIDQIPYFCVLDNGHGMDLSELNNAMLFGSDRSGKQESELELGKYGLGLKSASLSQCREFIVATKKHNEICAMSFDLDVIENSLSNDLLLKLLTNEEIDALPYLDLLRSYNSGTLVIWNKFDKIESTAKSFEDSFRNVVADVKKHIELVFHRFYESVQIFFNNKRIERRDPFLLESFGRQQTGRTTTISIGNSVITITPYTLPFANTLSLDEKSLLGNPKSIYDGQGFYIYRNKRLISWGNWMRMGVRSELNKLARIQVDIPSSLDEEWMLDVKKSSARIPDTIKAQIRAAVEDSVVRSNRTTRFPGVKEQTAELRVWDRIIEHDGKIRYQINRQSPAIFALVSVLGEREKELFGMVLSQIECYLPKYSISNDNMDALTIINSGEDAEEEVLIKEIETIISLCDDEMKSSVLDSIFVAENYQRLLRRKEEIKGEYWVMSNANDNYVSEINTLFGVLYHVLQGQKVPHNDVVQKAKQLFPVVLQNLVASPDHNAILKEVVNRYESEVGIQTFDPEFIDLKKEAEYWLYKEKDHIMHPFFDRYKLFLSNDGFEQKVIENIQSS